MLKSTPVIFRSLTVVVAIAVLGACAAPPSTSPTLPAPSVSPAPPAAPPMPPSTSSKYYADDGPPPSPPANLDSVPDATPQFEPLHRFANRPYTVLGRDYVPATQLRPYRERGVASWYGRKFHGQKTSIGEVYDMFAMTAAHPTLPLPSYARVTHPANGRSIVVRINDRGPFLHGRVIDLSYAAAHRLGIAQRGSGEVIVEAILPGGAAPSVTSPLPPVAGAAAGAPVVSGSSVAAENRTPALGGFVVQLGAFANFANAQNFIVHVQNQIATASVEPRVRQARGLWLVYVGPFAERDEARRAAERIASAFGLAVTVGGIDSH